MGTHATSKRSFQMMYVKGSSAESSFCSPRMLYRILLPAAVLMTFVWFGASQNAFADQKMASVTIPALLDGTLDSKKHGAGDEVDAKAAAPTELADGTVIPRGAKIVGHITSAKARSKGDSESSLTIVFEKVSMPGGKLLNIKGLLQAVAPSPDTGESGGGVDYGNSINRTLQHAGPGETSHSAVPILNPQSVGVEGIKDVALNADGVLTSPGKNVKIEHGAQIMLRAQVVGMQ